MLRSCLVAVTGWTLEYADGMPFREAVEMFENCPPLGRMLAEAKPEETNMMELGQAMAIASGGRRPMKLSKAPERDRQRFEALKEQMKKRAG